MDPAKTPIRESTTFNHLPGLENAKIHPQQCNQGRLLPPSLTLYFSSPSLGERAGEQKLWFLSQKRGLKHEVRNHKETDHKMQPT